VRKGVALGELARNAPGTGCFQRSASSTSSTSCPGIAGFHAQTEFDATKRPSRPLPGNGQFGEHRSGPPVTLPHRTHLTQVSETNGPGHGGLKGGQLRDPTLRVPF